jgi:hypothetical protein
MFKYELNFTNTIGAIAYLWCIMHLEGDLLSLGVWSGVILILGRKALAFLKIWKGNQS